MFESELEILDLQDLFKVRDACIILARYNLHNIDLTQEANAEINNRERPPFIDEPDEERDLKENV